jgi:glycosyltransferase involved in cell wall biosynthesis
MSIAIIEPVGGHGGMDYYDYGLASGLGNKGLNVLYYTCDETQIRPFKNVETIRIFKDVWHANPFRKAFRYLKGHFSAFRDAGKKNVKTVHLHFFTFRLIDYLVLRMAKQLKLTVVATIHDIDSFDKKANSTVEKICYPLIDGVIVHNDSSRKELEKKPVSIKKMAVIPHGNYQPFIEELPQKEINKAVFTLLFFGQIKQVKGLDILLKSLRTVLDKGYKVELIVAGKAWKSDLDYYKALIRELHIENAVKTDFRYIPDEEVSSFYSRADLVVLPYTKIYQSGILLLTMSYGRPVLCSDLNAFKEIITDRENGFLFRNKEEADLADKIIGIIKDPSVLPGIIDRAHRLIETKYDWNKIAGQTLDFYHSL